MGVLAPLGLGKNRVLGGAVSIVNNLFQAPLLGNQLINFYFGETVFLWVKIVSVELKKIPGPGAMCNAIEDEPENQQRAEHIQWSVSCGGISRNADGIET